MCEITLDNDKVTSILSKKLLPKGWPHSALSDIVSVSLQVMRRLLDTIPSVASPAALFVQHALAMVAVVVRSERYA